MVALTLGRLLQCSAGGGAAAVIAAIATIATIAALAPAAGGGKPWWWTVGVQGMSVAGDPGTATVFQLTFQVLDHSVIVAADSNTRAPDPPRKHRARPHLQHCPRQHRRSCLRPQPQPQPRACPHRPPFHYHIAPPDHNNLQHNRQPLNTSTLGRRRCMVVSDPV